jgi:cobaltochelatase CobN
LGYVYYQNRKLYIPVYSNYHQEWISNKKMIRNRSMCLYALLFASCFLLFAVPALAMAEEEGGYPMLQYDAQRTGNVSGIAPETATILWRSGEKTSGCIQAGPIVSDGRVYISTWWSSGMGVKGNGVDALYCLNEGTGEEIWNNTDIEENPSWKGVASSPLVVEDKVYVLSYSDGTLHAFSFDGTELEKFSTGGEIFCYASPSAYGDKIYFAGNKEGQHSLYCAST